MTQRLERRAFLKVALSCVAFLPSLGTVGCDGDDDASTARRARVASSRRLRLTDDFFDEAELGAAALIGQRYLDLVAPNATEDEIDELIAPTVQILEPDEDEDDAKNDPAALQALRARILADFMESSTTVVDGWTFANTELHLCVLARSIL